jgi:hypothetical protein
MIGILLIVSAEAENQLNPGLFSPFRNVFTSLSQTIYHAREEKLEKMSSTEVKSKENILIEINSVISEADEKNSKVSFLLLPFDSLLNKLKSRINNIDMFRIQEDIIRAITSMMPETDKIFFIDQTKLLVILSGRYHFSADMFVHQISVSLQHLFSSLENTGIEEYTLITYPDDAAASDDILKMFVM